MPAIAALKDAGLRRPSTSWANLSARGARLRSRRSLRRDPARLASRGLDANVSVKLTQMGLEMDRELCRANVMRILDAARAVDGFVRFDMEDHTQTDATLAIWQAAHEAYPQTGVVIQAALRRSSADVQRILAAGGRVRLCKGAYDEPRSVAYVNKSTVDANYAKLMERLLQVRVIPCPGHARPKLIARAIAISEREGIGADRSVPECSTACGATCSGCLSVAATRSGSTSRTDTSGIRTSCAVWPNARPTWASCCGPSSRKRAAGSGATDRLDRLSRPGSASTQDPWSNLPGSSRASIPDPMTAGPVPTWWAIRHGSHRGRPREANLPSGRQTAHPTYFDRKRASGVEPAYQVG